MKKFIILIFILCVSFSQAFAQSDGFFNGNSGGSAGGQNSNQEPQQEEYKPILSTVENPDAEHNKMLANTYHLLVHDKEHPMGSHEVPGATIFRIHKNWFLTCAHAFPLKQNNNEAVLKTGVSVKLRSSAPGSTAPFIVVLDLTVPEDKANGRIYYFNPKLKLDGSNNGRGDDLALLYVDSKDPNEKSFKAGKKEIKEAKEDLKALQGMFPMEMLEKMEKFVNTNHRKASSEWSSFINNKVNPFKLFVLEEKTVINELGYPGATSYYFPLTTYFVHEDDSLPKFTFEPMGTHKNTHAIFYKRINNLIHGTSGAPMMYGNYIVSVVSATNCSPMFTDKFSKWVKETMGSDYSPMFVRPKNSGGGTPVHGVTPSNWNSAAPGGP